MVGLLHDEPCCSDGMGEAFEGSDCAGPKPFTFHERGVHPLDPVQLPFRATAGIEESGAFKHADRSFDGEQRRPALPENGMADPQRLGKAGSLGGGHCAPAGAAMSEDQRSGTGQLRRRSLAF